MTAPSRRRVVATLSGALLWPAFEPAAAQPSRPLLGVVSWQPPSERTRLDAFVAELARLGYVAGVSYDLEFRATDGNLAATEAAVADLLRKGVAILVVLSTPTVHVAKRATQSVPIVMMSVADPLATGLVASLGRPGGNITGLSMLGADLAPKRVDLLHEMRPSLRVLGFLGSGDDPNMPTILRGNKQAADALGIRFVSAIVSGPSGIADGLAALRRDGAEVVSIQPIFSGHHETIVRMGLDLGLPIVADYPMFAEAGGLMSYGVNPALHGRRAAVFVDRILKGADPGELPIEQPTEIEFVINLSTARRLGWDIPQSVLLRADRVIE